MIISQEYANQILIKKTRIYKNDKREIMLIKRTYALTPHAQDNIGMKEENIEYAIKPTLMWKVIMVQIRGITKDYAERRKSMENEKEHDIIKTMKT